MTFFSINAIRIHAVTLYTLHFIFFRAYSVFEFVKNVWLREELEDGLSPFSICITETACKRDLLACVFFQGDSVPAFSSPQLSRCACEALAVVCICLS